MQFSIQRDTLLHPLQLVSSAADKKLNQPILSHVLLSLHEKELSLTATDTEIELIGRVTVDSMTQGGRITVPARKLVDICKSIPEQQDIKFTVENDRLLVRAGRGHFVLTTLSAADFPAIVHAPTAQCITLCENILKSLIEKTYFAMAQLDVRYYLNGLLFHVDGTSCSMVATDGHRLAYCQHKENGIPLEKDIHVILPRKSVLELMRLLSNSDKKISVHVSEHHLRITSELFTFTSKLIEGRFPDFQRVIPKKFAHTVSVDKQALKQALTRVAILSHDKHRGVRFVFDNNTLKIFTYNSEKETAEEEITVDYPHAALEAGFNITYIQDALNAITSPTARISFTNANSSVLVEPEAQDINMHALYVIMPMRL